MTSLLAGWLLVVSVVVVGSAFGIRAQRKVRRELAQISRERAEHIAVEAHVMEWFEEAGSPAVAVVLHKAPAPVLPISTMLESESFAAWAAAGTDLLYHEWLEQELAREVCARDEAEAYALERGRCEAVAYLEDAERSVVREREARRIAAVRRTQKETLERRRTEIRRVVLERLKDPAMWQYNEGMGRWCSARSRLYLTLEEIETQFGPVWLEEEHMKRQTAVELELRATMRNREWRDPYRRSWAGGS